MRSNLSVARLAPVSLCAVLAFVLWAAVVPSSASALITPVDLSLTSFPNPIGIQYDEEKKELLLSVNHPTGSPENFKLINSGGMAAPFTTVSGLTDEVYMAAIRNTAACPAAGGYSMGEVFFGTGTAGQIGRIPAGGGPAETNWVTLAPEAGLLRGGITQACAGPFSGDLVVTTTTGDVWLVKQNKTFEKLATKIVGDTFEGPATIPPEPAKYGPWAGKIAVASEDCGCVESVEAGTGVAVKYTGFTANNLGAEGVYVVRPNENFYAVDYTDGKIIGIPASELTPYVGDVFVTTEEKGTIIAVHWNPAANGGNGAFEDQQVIKPVGLIEGAAFAPIGVTPICFEGCEHWYSDGKPIPEGQKEKATTSGKLTFVVAGQSCTTTVADEETIVNPVGGGSGMDEVTSFNVTPCKAVKKGLCPTGLEIVAQHLPWKSHLQEGTPEPDPTEGIELEIRCHGRSLGTYTGTLTPLLGESTLTFNEASGVLTETGGGKGTLSVSGTEKVTGPKGDTKITSGPPAKNVWNIEKTQTISWGKLNFTWTRTINEGLSNKKREEIERRCEEEGFVEGELEACVAEREAKVRFELLETCEEEVAEGKYKSFEECLQAHETRKETVTLTCKKSDAGNIWNENGQGFDETVLFDLYECSSETCPQPVVTASGLPWPSTLEESPLGSGVIRDRTRGIRLTIECGGGKEGGAFGETFTGEVSPRWRNGSTKTGSSYDEFDEGAGALTGEPGQELRITGNDYTAGFEKAELITAATVFSKEKTKKTG